MDNIFLAEERIRLGFKAKEVADFAGVAVPTQSNYEKGKRSPDTKYLYEISKLGFDIHYVVTGERSVDRISKTDRYLLDLFKSTPKSIQSFIISGLQVHVDKSYQQQTIKEDNIINTFEKIENHSDQKLINND